MWVKRGDVGAHVGRMHRVGAKRGWQEAFDEVSGKEGEGEKWLEELDRRREEEQKREVVWSEREERRGWREGGRE